MTPLVCALPFPLPEQKKIYRNVRQEKVLLETSPSQQRQLIDRRCVAAGSLGHTRKETTRCLRTSLRASKSKPSQLSKSDRIHCDVDLLICARIRWRGLCWRIVRWIFLFWSGGFFVADFAREFGGGGFAGALCSAFFSFGVVDFRGRFFAADFSGGFPT